MPSDPRQISLPRRQVLTLAAGACLMPLLPRRAFAQSVGEAQALVQTAIDHVLRTVNSGRSEAAMFREFETIFGRYADIPTIARSVLGPPARSATSAQMRAFTEAFRSYMARKYGRTFRTMIGGEIEITGVRQVRNFVEVISVVSKQGEAPYEVRWLVSDGSGRTLVFNIIIDGVNLMISERTEIGSMLEAQRGNIDGLIAMLRQSG